MEIKIEDNILLFIRNFFEIEIDLNKIDLNKITTLFEIQNELEKLNVQTYFSNINILSEKGYCILNISTSRVKSYFLFCEFDTNKDKYNYYDFNKKIHYYSDKTVLLSMVESTQCLLFFLKKKIKQL